MQTKALLTSKPKTFRVKVGSVGVPLHPIGDDRWCIVYRLAKNTPRIRLTKVGLPAAKEAAEKICLDIMRGQAASGKLTPDQLLQSAAALHILQPHGLTLDGVARDVDAAIRLGGGASLAEMARFFARHHAAGMKPRTVAQVHQELLASKSEQALNARYRRQLDRDLRVFALAFPDVAMHEITSAQILDWLREQKVGWRRRNNLRDTVVTLFRFAKNQRYLAQDSITEPERIPKLPKPQDAAPPGVFSVAEMRIILANVRPEYLPWAVLGAFAGLRAAEIERLHWERDFHWGEGVIEISEAVAKRTTRKHGDARYVEMQPNLIAWLAPWRHATGPVCAHRSDRETGRLGKLLPGGTWPQNGLRHSSLSYLAALTGNLHLVAHFAGNSTEVARRNYLNPRMKRDAKAWFEILPAGAEPANVVALPGLG